MVTAGVELEALRVLSEEPLPMKPPLFVQR